MTDNQPDMPDEIYIYAHPRDNSAGRHGIWHSDKPGAIVADERTKYIRADLSRPEPSDAARKEAWNVDDHDFKPSPEAITSALQAFKDGHAITCVHTAHLTKAASLYLAALSAPSPMTVPRKVLEEYQKHCSYLHDCYRNMRSPTFEAVEFFKQVVLTAPDQSDALPCVSCGNPSDTSTPDDAEMCWKCFGEFNAAAFDEQREVIKALVEALEDARSLLKELSPQGQVLKTVNKAIALAEKAGGANMKGGK